MNREKKETPIAEKGEVKHIPAAHRPAKEHNRRWLFLLVDVLFLGAIVAAVIFLVSLLTPFSLFDKGADETRVVTYTVELVGVRREAVSALRVGDTVTDKETGAVIGTVTAINARAYSVYTDVPSEVKDPVLDSYVVTKTEYPEDFNTVEITVAVEADYVAGVGYSVEDCRIAVGRSYELYFPAYAGQATCIEMQIG